MRFEMPVTEFSFEEFLNSLNPEQLGELGKKIDEAKKTLADSQLPPIKLRLSIEIQDSDTVDPVTLHQVLAKQLGGSVPLTVEELKALQRIQYELVDWLQLSKENAALFAVDPIKALRQSGVQLDETLIARLEALSLRSPQVGLPDNITFQGVVVSARHSKEIKQPGSKPNGGE
jgi:hypothetical protein